MHCVFGFEGCIYLQNELHLLSQSKKGQQMLHNSNANNNENVFFLSKEINLHKKRWTTTKDKT